MRKRRQSGFAMLLIFVMAASIAIMLYMEMPRLMFEAQRQKEQLLIERGEQYQRAIQVFVRTNKRYPQKIEDLEEFQDKRYLRRKFKDPLTGKDEWRLIHVDAAGAYTDSLVHKPPDPMGKDKKSESQSATPAGQIGMTGAMLGPTGAPLEPGEVPAALQRRASDRPAVTAGDGQNVLPPCDPSQPYDATKPCDPNRAFGEAPSGNDPYNPSNPNPPPTPVDPNQPGAAQGSQPGQYPSQYPGQVPGQIPSQIPGQFPGQYPGAPGAVPGMPGIPGQGVNPTMPGAPLGQPVAFPPGVPFSGQFPPGTQPQYPGQQYPGQQQNPQGFQPQYPGQQYPGQQPAYPQGFQPQFPGQQFPGQSMPTPQGAANSQTGGFAPTTPGGPPGNAAAQLINQILTTPRNSPLAAGAAGGQQGMGAGIAGVASQGAGEGIRVYNEKSKYKEWEFLYDPKLEKAPGGGNMTGFGQQGQQGGLSQQGQQGRGGSGFGGSGFGGSMGTPGQGSSGAGFGGQGVPRGRTR